MDNIHLIYNIFNINNVSILSAVEPVDILLARIEFLEAEFLSDELHKSEILLIASTLLAVKTKNIYRNTIEMNKQWKHSSTFIQLLETLLLAITMCTDFTIDVICVNTKNVQCH